MESVMNFLADYYIWFFVAAGILCFALIGFIIESRKKGKNEFKGESIDNNVTPNTTNNVVDNNINANIQGVTPTLENIQPNTPVQMPESTTNVSPTNIESMSNVEAPVNRESQEMEINDIPLANPEPQNKPETVEFYSGPIEMPVETPKPMPVENLRDPFEMNEVKVEPEINNTIGEPISYNQVPEINQNNNLQPTNIEEKQENINNNVNNNDIFNG